MRKQLLGSLASVLLLAACSHYSDDLASMDGTMGTKTQQVAVTAWPPQAIAPAAGGNAAPAGQTLNNALSREYYTLAKFENDNAFDYKTAKQFTNKAMMASRGELVVPSKISSYDLADGQRAELTKARSALISALKTQSTPENAASLAKAQTSFDCWIERAEESSADTHYASCKNDFEQSMAMLTAPAAGDTASAGAAYDINFAASSAVIAESSQKDIDYIASFMNDPINTASTLTITGYTLPVPGEFTESLTNARIRAVTDKLAEKGVAVTRVSPVLSALQSIDPAIAAAPKVQLVLHTPQGTGPGSTTKMEYVPVTPMVVQTKP